MITKKQEPVLHSKFVAFGLDASRWKSKHGDLWSTTLGKRFHRLETSRPRLPGSTHCGQFMEGKMGRAAHVLTDERSINSSS